MRSILLVALLLLLPIKNACGQVQYTVTDLGTLPSSSFSDATAINSNGQVVGYSTGSNGQPQAFVYSGGSMQGLGTFSPSQSCSIATGINNAGQIVGYTQQSYGVGYGTGPTYSFIYSGGTTTQFSELSGPAYTFGNAIDNAGQVAGLSLVSNSDVTDGFLYSGGSMNDLGNLSGGAGGYSDAYGINDHAQIVGNNTVPNSTGRERAFLWQNGTMSDLGDLYGGSANAWAYSINNFGQVVGDSWQVAPSSAHAFLWQSGTMTDLGTLPGGNIQPSLEHK
jgi:probable HAF family extracellular repeat protein